jgi:hypothetical protein
MRALLLAVSLAIGAGLGACASSPPPRFPAKPSGCALEPVERLPRRPYIELETFSLPGPESMREVLDLVHDRACQDGADAVYAPKGGRTYSYAIALKWNDPAPSPPPPLSPPPPPLSPPPLSPPPPPLSPSQPSAAPPASPVAPAPPAAPPSPAAGT